MSRYTERELTEIFYEALECFNECFDSDIRKDNTALTFFTPENGLEIYEQFCRRYFPQNLKEDYSAKDYFQSFAAQAFFSEGQYGVMIRSDLDFRLSELHRIFLHEISHLFCSRNEIKGGNFFDRYCMGSGMEDGMMNAGYAIWREAIADIMADSVLTEYATLTLADVKEEVARLYHLLSPSNSDSKKCMSLIIVYIMLTKEVGGAANWADAESQLKKRLGIRDQMLIAVVRITFENLHQSLFWTITPEFIMSLGEAYLSLLSSKLFKKDRNIP